MYVGCACFILVKVPEDCGTPVIIFKGDIREASACSFRIDVGGMEVCEPVNFYDSVDCLVLLLRIQLRVC